MRKVIMKNAWHIAKRAENKFGKPARLYLSGSLKQAWVEYRIAAEALDKYNSLIGNPSSRFENAQPFDLSSYFAVINKMPNRSDGLKRSYNKIVNEYQRVHDLRLSVSVSESFSGRSGWVARIVGSDKEYGLDREFEQAVEGDGINKRYELPNGLYEVRSRGVSRYIKVYDGEQVNSYSKKEMLAIAIDINFGEQGLKHDGDYSDVLLVV